MKPIMTPRDAEENAAARMREFGFTDAKVTVNGPDEGIDVSSRGAVAQVKNWNKPVGRPELQRLYGARAGNQHQQMLFFARTGYTKTALQYADTHCIALFTFDHTGAITRANGAARTFKVSEVSSKIRQGKADEWHIDSSIISRVQSLIGLAGTPIQVREVSGCGDGSIVAGGVVARIRLRREKVEVSDLKKLQEDGGGRLFFFSKSSFTENSVKYANFAAIALFQINDTGRLSPVNSPAQAWKRKSHDDVHKAAGNRTATIYKVTDHKRGHSQVLWWGIGFLIGLVAMLWGFASNQPHFLLGWLGVIVATVCVMAVVHVFTRDDD